MDDFVLTNENYYSVEADKHYMSVHQYLDFVGHMGVTGCEEKAIAKQIEELRCLSLTKTGYRWFKFTIDKKLGEAILKLWNEHFREISEAEKAKEKAKALGGTIVL